TGLLAVVAHPDPAVLGPDRELRHRLIGRRAQGAAVADVEAGAMQHALHARLAGLETAGRQFEVLVRALVLERVQGAVEVEHHDAGAGDLVEAGLHLAREQVRGRADEGPGLAHAAAPSKRFSSTSKRRSSRSGTPKRSSP